MATSKAITPKPVAPLRCPKCGAQMLVINSVKRTGSDKRIYECARCRHEITEVIKFKEAS